MSHLTSTFLARVRANPYQTASLCVFLVAAYLCLVNLNYAALWQDEAPVTFLGKNLLEQGDIVGWDGRNLVGGPNGHALNEELRDVAPPLQYILTAAGFAVFGLNETGARIIHAVAGILALGMFYLVLRQRLSASPRLMFFMFLFAAWSAQLLLYFRQARYYSVTVLGMMAGMYLYERYWQTRRPRYLAALTVVATLAFFNHYAVGTATMLSLAALHLLFRARETSRREWIAFAACGSIVGAIGLAYLTSLGLIGGDRDPTKSFLSSDFGEYDGTFPLFLLRLWLCFRDLFTADWISWPVFLWFVGMVLLVHGRRKSEQRPGIQAESGKRSAGNLPARSRKNRRNLPPVPVAAVSKIILTGALFALFSALLSPQPVWVALNLDLRYYVPALPLLLAMKGLFAEWVWRYSKLVGGAVLAVLLLTSAGAYPFNIIMVHDGKRTLGFHLFQFIGEIHRPYPTALETASDYLLKHAEQDDLVYTIDREVLTWYTGHLVQFSNVLDDDSPLPRAKMETLRKSLYVGECVPDWIVVFGRLSNEYRERVSPWYDFVTKLDVHPTATQRPEINSHSFQPLPMRDDVGVFIFRKKAEA